MFELVTRRLRLRHAKDEDADFMLQLLNDPSFIENIGDRKVRTLAQAKAYLSERMVSSYQVNGFGMYVVETLAGGHRIGLAGLVKREGLDAIDIGYALLPEFCRQGYALEASQAVVEDAQTRLNLHRLVAITVEHNLPSIRLLEKLNMHFERMVTLPGDDQPVRLYTRALRA